jgi:hypothetical protein
MDPSIGFGTWTHMLLDRLQKVAGSAVVEKKHALAHVPEGRGAELVGTRVSLRDVVP